MLPALRLRFKSGEAASFTRRPLWVRPLESLWSILAKWQFVNCLPYSHVVSTLLVPSVVIPDQGIDLRVLCAFQVDAFVEHSGLSQSMLANAACCSSGTSHTIGLVSQHLRFCAVCMQEGFHAALFQFKPIRSCLIHRCHIREACPQCRSKIPYRLDASFAAHPFACPQCAFSLMADPRALARQDHPTAAYKSMLQWQQFVAAYVHWYGRAQVLKDDGTRLSFIGSLQELLDAPPPVPILRCSPRAEPPAAPMRHETRSDITEPPYSRLLWPRFCTKRFLTLYQRYQEFLATLQTLTSPRQCQVTHWWRRSWEGAVARSCEATTDMEFPPFGISEWLSFSKMPDRTLRSGTLFHFLVLRFEHDLRQTWEAWDAVIEHMGNHACGALHPHLVPPRACWLTSPTFESGSPALGY